MGDEFYDLGMGMGMGKGVGNGKEREAVGLHLRLKVEERLANDGLKALRFIEQGIFVSGSTCVLGD
jgi:hypothetical protein